MKLYKSEPQKIVSDFAQEFNFDELRPYYDNESDGAMHRMITYDPFFKAMAYLFENPKLLNNYKFYELFQELALTSSMKL